MSENDLTNKQGWFFTKFGKSRKRNNVQNNEVTQNNGVKFATLLKKELSQVFFKNWVNVSGTPILKNSPERLVATEHSPNQFFKPISSTLKAQYIFFTWLTKLNYEFGYLPSSRLYIRPSKSLFITITLPNLQIYHTN